MEQLVAQLFSSQSHKYYKQKSIMKINSSMMPSTLSSAVNEHLQLARTLPDLCKQLIIATLSFVICFVSKRRRHHHGRFYMMIRV